MRRWFVFLFLASCQVSSFSTRIDPQMELGQYNSFAFADYTAYINITQPEYDNPENRALIEQSIKNEMEARGIKQSQLGKKLWVAYTLSIKDMTDTRVDSAIIYKPWIDLKQDTFNYTQGAFSLVLIDGETKTVIAQSQIEGILDRDPKRFRSAIPRLVKRMFKRIEEEAIAPKP
ncbi:MAG: DUF4136 domain-containing protein [Cyclobacteriaceae bacterium]|nr:DUF4136 domain-containing protein [Cyclobacteriaceae bacterium]